MQCVNVKVLCNPGGVLYQIQEINKTSKSLSTNIVDGVTIVMCY